jgi:hypothetical protein
MQTNTSSLQSYEELFRKVRLTNAQKEGKTLIEAEEQAFMISENSANLLQICKVHDPLVMLNSDQFIERQSPISDKFYILTREGDSVSAT